MEIQIESHMLNSQQDQTRLVTDSFHAFNIWPSVNEITINHMRILFCWGQPIACSPYYSTAPMPCISQGDVLVVMLVARYHALVQVHNELQEWLITLCSPCIQMYVNHLHNLLSMRLNMIPLQYEGMSWIKFSPLSFLHACCHLPCLLHMHHWHLCGSLL